jgi:hypothetical protein
MTPESYEATMKALGEGVPPGLQLHVASQAEKGFLIFAVWDSQEALDAFSPTFGKALSSAGVGGPGRRLLPTHHVIKS